MPGTACNGTGQKYHNMNIIQDHTDSGNSNHEIAAHDDASALALEGFDTTEEAPNPTSPPSECISLFRTCKETEPVGDISISDVVEFIRNPKQKTLRIVEEVRRLVALGDKKSEDQATEIKKGLAAVTLSGTFERRNKASLVNHSGLITIDFDKLTPDELDTAWTKLTTDPHVIIAFRSPSGAGIKGAVRVPVPESDAGHLSAWFACERYFKETHGLTLDPSGKDVCRLCYFSHDADCFHNESALRLDTSHWQPVPPSTPSQRNSEIPPPDASRQLKAPKPEGWIFLPSGPTGNLASAESVFAALATSERYYVHGGRVVELTESSTLKIVEPEFLRSAIDEYGVVAKWKSDREGKPVISPNERASADNAKMWLASPAKEILDQVDIVCVCPPIIEEEAGVPAVLRHGYNQRGKVIVTSQIEPQQMPLEEAVRMIGLPLEEYDFVTPADRARAIAAIVTPALVIGGTLNAHAPMFVAEGDGSQAGKGLLLELIQSIYAEKPQMVAQKASGVGSFDESLAAALVAGRTFIQLDNFRGKLNSQFLEMVMTVPHGTEVQARVPYKGEIGVKPEKYVFQLTSNGIETTTDLANRCCITRIRIRPSDYQFRQFPEGGLADHVAANQAAFLGAVYTIVAHWISEGKPRTRDCRAPGRFRKWGQSLDWICQELCGTGPLLDGHVLVQQRATNSGLGWLRSLAQVIAQRHDSENRWAAAQLVDLSEDEGIDMPGLREGADDTAKHQWAGRTLAKIFQRNPMTPVQVDDLIVEDASVEIDGMQVIRSIQTEAREDGRGSREAKRYRFTSPYPPLPHRQPETPCENAAIL